MPFLAAIWGRGAEKSWNFREWTRAVIDLLFSYNFQSPFASALARKKLKLRKKWSQSCHFESISVFRTFSIMIIIKSFFSQDRGAILSHYRAIFPTAAALKEPHSGIKLKKKEKMELGNLWKKRTFLVNDLQNWDANPETRHLRRVERIFVHFPNLKWRCFSAAFRG